MFNQSNLQTPRYDSETIWLSLECLFYPRITNRINTFCEQQGIQLGFDVPQLQQCLARWSCSCTFQRLLLQLKYWGLFHYIRDHSSQRLRIGYSVELSMTISPCSHLPSMIYPPQTRRKTDCTLSKIKKINTNKAIAPHQTSQPIT